MHSTNRPPRGSWSVRAILVRTTALVLALLAGLGTWVASHSEALREAESAYKRGSFARALKSAQVHLKRRPWSHAAAVLAARSLSELNRADEAESSYHWAERTGSLSLDDQHVRAFGLLCADRPEKAIAVYQEILRRRPADLLALRRLAAIYYSRKRMDQARKVAEQLTRIPTGAVVGYALIGSICHDEHEMNRAIAAYEKVVELDPGLQSLPIEYAIFWNELTMDLIDSGRAEEARRLLAAELDHRDDADLHYLRGLAEESLGATDSVETCWQRAVARDPKSVRSWRALGRFELKKGRPDQAVEHLTRAAALDPDDYETVYSLSLACRQLGRDEAAVSYAKKAEQLRSKLPRPRTGMGASHPP